MSDSSPQNDAGPLDAEKTHVVPPPTPSPSDLVHKNAGRLLAGMLGSAPGSWEQEGDVIGPYRLCEIIGEGGFGNVWHAEQTEVIKREVALKLIKPGMDSAQVLGRFNQERQALASLRHPNIAMLLDVGVSPSGRPYFAMELVSGGPITVWCKAADATLQERLRLFIQICHAVQHAHEKGILHRDIKPTNILVADINGQPVPKVIDFGVAKALNASSLEELTLLTQADQAVGTPLYMSPEQIQGDRELDARSDVYALGVVLYELLTGSLPFDTTSAAARGVEGLKRLILDSVPERPSTRVRRRTGTQQRKPKKGFEASLSMLPADLDWITMRALEKDRQRRYPTAADFAADIQRHLDCQPVLARPPSVTYRTGRWMRRHRGVLVPACAAVAFSAVAILAFRQPVASQVSQIKLPAPLPPAEVAQRSVTNSLGMKFVPVPGTKVLFCIHETRLQDYAAYAAAVAGVDETWRHQRDRNSFMTSDNPVACVNWADAQDFCRWLSKKDGRACRLPTDHEWSLAAGLEEAAPLTNDFLRTGLLDTTLYPWGTYFPPQSQDGNYADKTAYTINDTTSLLTAQFGHNSDRIVLTAPVMRFRANPFGLYDMGGNVSEWCVTAPDPARTTEIQRGGSYSTLITPENLLSSSRLWIARTSRGSSHGFRVVLETGAAASPTSLPQHARFEQSELPAPLPPAEVAQRSVTNSLGMKFVPVPGTPVLFCIHETRRQDYAAYAAAVPQVDDTWRGTPPALALTDADHPVTSVNWDDVRAFCAWLSQKESRAYRPPTDHEWSLAVGLEEAVPLTHDTFGTEPLNSTLYPWGTHFPPDAQDGNYADKTNYERKYAPWAHVQFSANPDAFVNTAPVMSFRPNPFGLYDLGGNVSEWCAFTPGIGARLGEVHRGASYDTMTTPQRLKSSSRYVVYAQGRPMWGGFRVVLDPDSSPAAVTAAGNVSASTAASSLQPAEGKPMNVTNSLGMKFVPVAGTKVLFCIHETRNQDYTAYAAAVPGVDEDWKSKTVPLGEGHPVSFTNWDDAQKFCAWLSRKENKSYRLPTDHEWSLAAGLDEAAPLTHETLQAGPLNKTHYPWNGRFPPEAQDGNYAGKELLKKGAEYIYKVELSGCDDGFEATSPVMSFRANPFGLYDMGGNLAEMCVFPPDAEGKRTEVLRGAYHLTQTTPENLLSSCRVWPAFSLKRSASNGFRVVLEVDASPAKESSDKSVTNNLGMKFVPVPDTDVLFCIHETRRQDYAAYASSVPGVDSTWRGSAPDMVLAKADHPVTSVSWDDAQAFCAWLSQKENKLFRLPTDHEWSMAAGLMEIGGTYDVVASEQLDSTHFPWGTYFPQRAEDGNYGAAEAGLGVDPDGFQLTAPVMSYRPNSRGLFDLGGNIEEWCTFPHRLKRAAEILRGASYETTSRHLLLASTRHWVQGPSRTSSAGFRVVLETGAVPGSASASKDSVQSPQPASHPRNLMPVQFEFPPARTADEVAKLTVTNSLGMKFLPVTIHGGPTDKQQVLFSIWHTRLRDYQGFAKETKREWPKPFFEQGTDHPAVNVSWEDANAFCAWLTEKERKAGKILADQSYRLPGDREWSCAVGISELEDATRDRPDNRIGRKAAIYPWGAQATRPDHVGNYFSVEALPLLTRSELSFISLAVPPGYHDGHAATSPVGSYPPNHLGLYDMGGNVWQWMAEASPPPAVQNRILRGASWEVPFLYGITLTHRIGGLATQGRDDVGFRVVLTAGPPETATPPGSKVPDPQPPEEVKKNNVTNSLGMKFVPVAGTTQDGNYAGQEWLKLEARHHSKALLSRCNDGFLVTSPVMSFRANPFGLYDMGGNLAEMCVFPPDTGGKGTEVLRGAYFYTQTTPENLLSSCRAWPTSPSIRGSSHGFRVVLEP